MIKRVIRALYQSDKKGVTVSKTIAELKVNKGSVEDYNKLFVSYLDLEGQLQHRFAKYLETLNELAKLRELYEKKCILAKYRLGVIRKMQNEINELKGQSK